MLNARDRPAARADFENVHHRYLNRQRLFVAADQRASGGQRLTVKDHASLGSGAAHVEGDRVFQVERLRDRLSADDAGRRSGFQHPDAFRLGAADAEQSAGRLNDEKIAGKSVADDPPLDVFQVTAHARANIGVGDDRRATLEFAVLLRQLVRSRNEMAGKLLLQDRLGAAFVRGVAIAVQKQDRYRFDVLAAYLRCHLPQRVFVERGEDFTTRCQSFGHLVASIARYQRRMF